MAETHDTVVRAIGVRKEYTLGEETVYALRTGILAFVTHQTEVVRHRVES